MTSLRPLTPQERLDQEIGAMLRKTAADPKKRRQVYRFLKGIDPSVSWPDQSVEDLKEELKEKAEKEQIDAEVARQHARLSEQKDDFAKRYDADTIKAIEALMQKHGIYDYEVARKLYIAETPEATSRPDLPGSSRRWDMPTDKDLIKDPAKWANTVAENTLRELRAATTGRSRR